MEKQIYYHDTDAGGVVYYGNYLKFMEEARTEYLEKKGLSIKYFHDQGFLYAVRKCHIIYKSPARYGDIIICGAQLKKITAAQFIFDQTIFKKDTNQLLVEAEVTLVSLNRSFKPITIPEDIRKKMLPL
ncbi:MAG: YbgC/FadM family acyl-CoA thioesterase [Candidatus Omnitrophica bacterium]|nr:YbgC/FadM family acyl-CoA thioesterase [Candidatus Omnitrophota bacterium]